MKESIQEAITSQKISDEAFDELALQLFAEAYQQNEIYRNYCQAMGKGKRQVKTWKDIPAVSTDAFKTAFLSKTSADECARIFQTSGTTTGNPGKHYHKDLDIYDLSAVSGFKEFVMDETRPIAVLFPPEEEMPHSSLAHYLTYNVEQLGSEDSSFFVKDRRLLLDELRAWLKKHSDEPVLILGATYNYVNLIDALADEKASLPLHEDSLVFDTGGYKNLSRELEEEEFYDLLSHLFELERSQFINMYGMTELSSEYYAKIDQTPTIYHHPDWMRFKIIDPVTAEEVPQGEQGLLVHLDLANINSVPAIMTEDLGIDHGDGFELLGRQANSDPKGCSIAAQQYMEQANA